MWQWAIKVCFCTFTVLKAVYFYQQNFRKLASNLYEISLTLIMNIIRTYTECASFLYISCTAFPRDTGCSSDRTLNKCKYMHVLCSIAVTSANEFTHLLIRRDSLGLYILRLIFSYHVWEE